MRNIQYREALREAMQEEMRTDDRIFLMGEEVAEYNGAYKVSQGMVEEFGARRIVDSPISETGFAGLGVGAAMYGLRPIIEFMSWSFCLVAADQIINNAPKMLYMSGGQFGCPAVFRGNNGAGGQLGSTHSWCVESMFSSVPGLKLAVPSTPRDAKGMLKAAIRDEDPVFYLESERMLGLGARGDKDFSRYLANGKWAPPSYEEDDNFVIEFGKADIKKPGADCTIVTAGRPVHFALDAAEELEKEGIDVEVIDVRTYRPLDIETIVNSVRKTNYCVVVDQSWPFASVASEIASQVYERCFDDLDNSIIRVNNDDVPAPYNRTMEQEMLPNARKIAEAVRSVTYNS
ncbi:2-oxoisovalerate dehydrogenase subunit beta [Poriferisphaera corsica]|uniref:2-oxoisovalerate dehydrogenase subunit beta n=1 Tax=Poriferisphaera corsica TaxID=2528020 RepID=A0A517YPM9_9BACT|nr:pyruvate dehydrogenase complex E1 component subunit beta [Poriferisphaera corsica]QDU32168.1 2-oxoisovalerate dehydrogenase subunit beta [Poriferisphaera corsica]